MADFQDNSARPVKAGKWVWQSAKKESRFTHIWFLTMAAISFGLTFTIPLGGMTPGTQSFAFFSINPKLLAQRYKSDSFGLRTFNGSSISNTTFSVIPDVYKIGMSGVCREYRKTKDFQCTQKFPQLLDLGAIIMEDIQASNQSNTYTSSSSSISQMQSLFNSLFTDANTNLPQVQAQTTPMIKVSAALVILSLILAPSYLAAIILLYMLERPFYPKVATCFAIFDASLIITAAGLWLAASAKYTAALNSILEPSILSPQPPSSWGSDLYPVVIGVHLFASAALAKFIVLPILALVALVVLGFVVLASILLVWMILACLGACASDERKVVVEQVYYSYPTPDWARS
ncbi:hypothetical protein BJ875DRAFT_496379 [Amylocarpus encephaloides]|uniref:Uncharacterized protein n=1 Tax=Amylocarpus encephaloides TaxID=45428 RepID=A0A9P7YHW7_9HELO|nr:hypothetical protein BJ875DRAFT_496379 [Amylocarpus encephaloides]